jgi:hypothetical protein
MYTHARTKYALPHRIYIHTYIPDMRSPVVQVVLSAYIANRSVDNMFVPIFSGAMLFWGLIMLFFVSFQLPHIANRYKVRVTKYHEISLQNYSIEPLAKQSRNVYAYLCMCIVKLEHVRL